VLRQGDDFGVNKSTEHMEKQRPELQFVTTSDEILRILIHSKEYGNVVGIVSPVLGAGMFITAVEKVVLDYEVVVQIKAEDINGEILECNTLRLSDITCACPFRTRFEKLYHPASKQNAQVGVYSY
jgi:hypothetical protein